MILAPIAALAGLLRGIREGMTMHAQGVREHRWFKWYHALAGLAYWLFAWLVWQWRDARPGWITAAGLALIVWEFTEIGYLIARPELGAYEHVAFVDIISFNVSGAAAYALHGVRLAAGITLAIIGHGGDRKRRGR